MPRRRGALTPAAYAELRMAVLNRDGYRCLLCGRRGSDANPLQVHHVIPRSRGGTDHRAGLASLHAWECHPAMSANGWKRWKDFIVQKIERNERWAVVRSGQGGAG